MKSVTSPGRAGPGPSRRHVSRSGNAASSRSCGAPCRAWYLKARVKIVLAAALVTRHGHRDTAAGAARPDLSRARRIHDSESRFKLWKYSSPGPGRPAAQGRRFLGPQPSRALHLSPALPGRGPSRAPALSGPGTGPDRRPTRAGRGGPQ